MQYEEFIERGQERSGKDTREGAVEITEATLETLGERLDRKTRNSVAAQLPNELQELINKREEGKHYDAQEFYRRMGARSEAKYYDAAEQAKAVFSVLREALSPGASLPGERGRNSMGKNCYEGPCPPHGETHRYFFRLYAADMVLNIGPEANRAQVVEALQDHTLEETELSMTVQNNGEAAGSINQK